MESPVEQDFDSRELLLASVREHAFSQGYAITVIRSNANKNVFLGCDRGGTYHDRVNALDGAKRRLTSTRRISCPFRLYGKRISDHKWELKVRNPCHNHTADENMTGHPAARQLTEEQLQKILHLSEIGSTPRNILALIKREFPNALATPRDIYNARSALRRQKLGNNTPVGCLQKTLQENFGLPCAHRIASLLKGNEAIPLTEIHPFWKTGLCENTSAYVPLLEPLIPLPKPRKRKRDQSKEEEKGHIGNQTVSARRKAPSKCTICGIVGHTRKTCNNS